MKSNSVILWLLLVWIALAVIDMWFDIVSAATFIKLSITIGLLMVAVLGVWLFNRAGRD